MSGEIHFRLPKWLREDIEKEAKEHKVTITDIVRVSILYRALHYKGKYDRDTICDMEFEARKKVEKK